MVPTSFGNYMMGTIYYENMNRLQKLSAELNDPSNENYQYYAQKIPMYANMLDMILD